MTTSPERVKPINEENDKNGMNFEDEPRLNC